MTTTGPDAPKPSPFSRLLLLASTLALLIWMGFLTFEVATSANPIIVSRPQAFEADVVVVGAVADQPPRVVVEEELFAVPPLTEKELRLLDYGAYWRTHVGERYLFLLDRRGEGYRIQPVRTELGEFRDDEPRVYPARAEVIEQTRGLMAHRRAEGEGKP